MTRGGRRLRQDWLARDLARLQNELQHIQAALLAGTLPDEDGHKALLQIAGELRQGAEGLRFLGRRIGQRVRIAMQWAPFLDGLPEPGAARKGATYRCEGTTATPRRWRPAAMEIAGRLVQRIRREDWERAHITARWLVRVLGPTDDGGVNHNARDEEAKTTAT